jgi:hypothetical protein
MKRNPRKVKWTKAYRKLAGKELAEVRLDLLCACVCACFVCMCVDSGAVVGCEGHREVGCMFLMHADCMHGHAATIQEVGTQAGILNLPACLSRIPRLPAGRHL